MLVVLHPRCKYLFVHALTKCYLRGKTVSSTYLTNNGNGLHTSSLNVNHAIANESSVGELTTSLQALNIFLTSSQCLSSSASFASLSTNFAFKGLALTLQSVTHLDLMLDERRNLLPDDLQ